MLTFKEFLLEGGKATEKLGTVRATQIDIKHAIAFVSRELGIPKGTLQDRLLGSGRLTATGLQKDSGDVDIAINDQEVDRDGAISKLTKATGNKPHVTGGSTYSFAIPTIKDRKVQVDLMFVPDVKWAKFSHHASEHSQHKSGVRNELIHSALKFSQVEGQDVRHKDEDGNDIARASRAYKLDKGVERIFKVAPERKDGNGRVKSMIKTTPAEVRDVLDKEGQHDLHFSDKPDIITDPDKFASMLFGPRIKAKDLMSTEQLIRLIKKYKSDNADKIFKDAVKGMIRLKFEVPKELQMYK